MNKLTLFLDKHRSWSTFILRIGIGVVFLWFGIDKFVHVSNWTGWVPQWMEAFIPMSLTNFMYVQGVIESVVGLLLIIGYQMRLASTVAVITLLGIELAMVGTGQTEMMLRDAGLLAASLSLLLTGSKHMSIDELIEKRRTK